MVEQKIRKGYKQTELGIIPEDWVIGKLEDFFSFISYGFTNPMPTTTHGISLITATDIDEGEIQLATSRHTTIEAYSKLTAKSKPKQNDILLTKDGTLGRLALVDNEKICINQSVAIIRPNYKIIPLFLKYLLESPLYQRKMIQDAGGSTIKHIYITIVNLMKIAVPKEKSEQIKIAETMSNTNQLIKKYEKLIQKKKNIKQGAMQELLTGKRRLEGFSGEWKIMPFDKIFLKTPTKNFQIKTSEYKNSGKYPIIDQGKEKIIGYTDNEKKVFSCPKNGIIIFGDHTREVKFVNENFVIGADGTQIISTKNSSDITKFFFYQIKIKNIPNTGYNRHFKFLLEHEFFQPETEEQKAISNILSEMDSEIQHLETQRDKYIQLKQGMMQKLLTGEIRLV